MKKTKAVLGVLLFCFSSVVAAASAPAQWYDQVTLKYVYAGQVGGRVAIGINGVVNSGSCPSYGEFVLDPNANPYFKTMLTLIMVAYTTEWPISVFTNGDCATTGVLFNDVRLP